MSEAASLAASAGDTISWVILAVVAVIAVVDLWFFPRIWRRLPTTWRRTPVWWVWGDALWRGYVRAMPLGVIEMALFVVMIAVLAAGEKGPVASIVVFVFMLVLVVMVSIVLFNRPRFAVPPKLRHERGALGEWLHDRA